MRALIRSTFSLSSPVPEPREGKVAVSVGRLLCHRLLTRNVLGSSRQAFSVKRGETPLWQAGARDVVRIAAQTSPIIVS